MTDAFDYLSDTLPAVLEILQSSSIRELEVQDGDLTVRLRRSPLEVPPSESPEPIQLSEEESFLPLRLLVTSPLVGTFYRAPAEGETLFDVGSRVQSDDVVGVIEALQVLTEVEAGRSGTITVIHAEDGRAVEYGQPLFEIATDD